MKCNYGLCADCKIVPLTHPRAVACSGCNMLRKTNRVEWWLKYESNRWCKEGRPYKAIKKDRLNLHAARLFLFNEQEGVCKFCHMRLGYKQIEMNDLGRNMPIDHDHHTGLVRGLVHVKCNQIIGILENVSIIGIEIPLESVLKHFLEYTKTDEFCHQNPIQKVDSVREVPPL